MDESQAMQTAQPIIMSIAKRLCQKFPQLDLHEVFGEGQLPALEAIRTFEEGRSKLENRIYAFVAWHYGEHIRYPGWRRKVSKQHRVLQQRYRKSDFCLRRLLFSVSDKAQSLIVLALNKEELLPILKELKARGWEKSEVIETFREVQEAL